MKSAASRVKTSPMRPVLAVAVLAIGCSDRLHTDPGPAPPATTGPVPALTVSAAATSAAKPMDCTVLAEHWRSVWTTEARAGIERRARKAADYASQQWIRECNKQAPAAAVLEDLRKLRTFSAIGAEPQTGGEIRRLLLVTVQGISLRSQLAYALPTSGVDECEDAFVDAAFCGGAADADKRIKTVGGFADKKDGAACAAYVATLASQCPGQ